MTIIHAFNDPAGSTLTVPNAEMQFITTMLQFLVPFERFRNYSPCIMQELKEGKIAIYLGAAFRWRGQLSLSEDKPLVQLQYVRSGNAHSWRGHYRNMPPLQNADFGKVIEHVRKQIAEREKISLDDIPAYVPAGEAKLPYTPRKQAGKRHSGQGKAAHLRVVK